MKIVIISLSFYPDHTGISLYSSDFAFYAAEQGHDVHVVTGYPFYPGWKKRKDDEGKLFSTDKIRGITIHRGYFYVPALPTTFKRILQEITFLLFSFVNFFRAGRPDVIVVFTAPITMGCMAVFFKKIFGSKLVINVQDFQLEAASSLDMVSTSFVFKLLGKLEKVSYKFADLVTSISGGMCRLLTSEKDLPANKTYLWPNWIDVNKLKNAGPVADSFRIKHQVSPDSLVIAYAGNTGLKQGLEIFIDLADAFRNDPQKRFFLAGEGAALPFLKEYAAKRGVDNLEFLPLFNQEEYQDFLAGTDIFFLSQKKTASDIYFPSKLLGLMAAKKLILLSADENSELYRTVHDHQVGFVSAYGDIDGLISHVKTISADTELQKKIRKAAESYVSSFDRKFVLDQVLDKIANL